MRQSARLSSGKVTSKYRSQGSVKKRQQVQKNIKTDGKRDKPGVIVSENEIDSVNEQGSLDDGGIVSDDDRQSDDSEYDGEGDGYDGISNQEEGSSNEIEAIKKMDKKSALTHIKKNYSNPDSIICYSSISGLKDLFKNLTEEEISNVLSTFETWSLMKSSRAPKKYNPFLAQHLRDVWQIDCISMKEIAKQNLGINYLFCAIDVFSKFLWVVPLYSTKATESTKAINAIFCDLDVLPEAIVCDSGPEFRNELFIKMMKNLNIKLIFSQSSFKASHVERAQYTLERLIYSHITAYETLKYIDVLQHLVKRYNHTKHSFTGFTPFIVENDEKVQDQVLIKFAQRYDKVKPKAPKYKVGDTVRMLLYKSPFHRGYNIQRSYERYKIHKILPHKLPLYVLSDEQDRVMIGLFNEYELTKVKLSRYRVVVNDSMTRKGKKWIKVHYKGYSSDLDEWREVKGKEFVNIADEQSM